MRLQKAQRTNDDSYGFPPLELLRYFLPGPVRTSPKLLPRPVGSSKPFDSTTKVSPSQWAMEYPYQRVFALGPGSFRPSVHRSRQTRSRSKNSTTSSAT